MKNYIQPGNVVTVVAPAAVAAGAGVLVGGLFGVAVTSAGSGANVEIARTGVFELVKVGSQAWTQGALVYWDNANSRCTTSASGNTLIGFAAAAVAGGAGDTLGVVILD